MERLKYYIKQFYQEDREPLEALHSRIFIKRLLHYSYLPYCGFDVKLAGEKDGIVVSEYEFRECDKWLALIDLVEDPIEFVESELLNPFYKDE